MGSFAFVSKLAFFLFFVVPSCLAARKLTYLVEDKPSTPLKYHKGDVLKGHIPISILWYGKFSSSQKTIITDFLLSLTPEKTTSSSSPSVSKWWKTIEEMYLNKVPKGGDKTHITLSTQVSDEKCSLGRTLKKAQIAKLAAKTQPKRGGGVALVFTADDVSVEGFCMSSCGSHGSDKTTSSAYIWVGNSETQCPGHCAWPFHRPIYGPQGPALLAPNGDVGVDGMVINLASLLAGTVTNPFGNGYFQGPRGGALEVASACTGKYGKGAFPGYAGELLVDETTGASYNAKGVAGRRYLLPGLFDPVSGSCSTLV